MSDDKKMTPIIIRQHPSGGLEVVQGDLTTGGLNFGEMLEQITHLTRGFGLAHGYQMQTQEEWEKQYPNLYNASEEP
jgi:hypothetical protein